MFRCTPIMRLAIAGILLCAMPTFAKPSPNEAIQVARQYFEAMDSSDLDAAEALFAADSSVFESGGSEGTWQNYREHHIGPELGEIDTFETTLGEPESEPSVDGSMVYVAWPIEYHIKVQGGHEIDSRGTVTFVLVRDNDSYRIRHLHWSSRPKR